VPKGKKLPDEVINLWPEIFKDVTVESVPIEYLHSVRVTFIDGKVWEIDTSKSIEGVDVETALRELMLEYESSIANVDFRLDTERVKKDITRRTAQFLKKRK
jgi:hypothetical protein